jgi:microcystin-dependent protein
MSMRFDLFTQESAGVEAWSETQSVSVIDGNFTVALGDTAAIPAWLFAQPSLYLQIEVDGQQLAGRQRILTVPYAHYAAGTSAVPTGSITAYAGSQAPAGWLLCDGRELGRTEYPALYAAIGTTYGAGDGSSTFNLPDLRGRFLRGWDGGTNRDADSSQRSAGNGQYEDWATGVARAGMPTSSANLNHTHSYLDWYNIQDRCIPKQSPNPYPANELGNADEDNNNERCEDWRETEGAVQNLEHAHAVTSGDAETRPVNVAVNWIIKVVE